MPYTVIKFHLSSYLYRIYFYVLDGFREFDDCKRKMFTSCNHRLDIVINFICNEEPFLAKVQTLPFQILLVRP